MFRSCNLQLHKPIMLLFWLLRHVWLCDPWPPGSSAHGISQARILAWVAISFSTRSSQSTDLTRDSCLVSATLQMDSLQLNHQGRPKNIYYIYITLCCTTEVNIVNQLYCNKKKTFYKEEILRKCIHKRGNINLGQFS